MTPQERSLKWFRDGGFVVATVEGWKRFPCGPPCPRCNARPMTQLRKDLFGFADLLALGPNGEHYLVQVCDGSSHSTRVAKITTDPEVTPWVLKVLARGMKILVISWALQGPNGVRKTYKMRMEEITAEKIRQEVEAF